MAKCARILVLAALVALGIWGWRVLFPNPERVIRSRLTALAKTLSFAPNEGTLARFSNAQRVVDYFSDDIQVVADVPGYQETLNGRDKLLAFAMFIRREWSGLQVEFLDISVNVSTDKQSAVVDCAGKATVPGDRDLYVHELKFTLQKIDGKWLIRRVQTVKTLSLNRLWHPPIPCAA